MRVESPNAAEIPVGIAVAVGACCPGIIAWGFHGGGTHTPHHSGDIGRVGVGAIRTQTGQRRIDGAVIKGRSNNAGPGIAGPPHQSPYIGGPGDGTPGITGADGGGDCIENPIG